MDQPLTFSKLERLAAIAPEYRTFRAKHPEVSAQKALTYLRASPAESFEQFFCAHEFAFTGTAYGGDDTSYHGEGRCYCSKCGLDGDG